MNGRLEIEIGELLIEGGNLRVLGRTVDPAAVEADTSVYEAEGGDLSERSMRALNLTDVYGLLQHGQHALTIPLEGNGPHRVRVLAEYTGAVELCGLRLVWDPPAFAVPESWEQVVQECRVEGPQSAEASPTPARTLH